MLEHDEKTIQLYKEHVGLINLGFEENKREVKIWALLGEDVKKRLVKMLKKCVDVFAWLYRDIPGLDIDIVDHWLPIKPECPLMKQKLRKTYPDMAVKIREEVQKQIDVGFLVTYIYPQWVAILYQLWRKIEKSECA